jgi:hypothetical protein
MIEFAAVAPAFDRRARSADPSVYAAASYWNETALLRSKRRERTSISARTRTTKAIASTRSSSTATTASHDSTATADGTEGTRYSNGQGLARFSETSSRTGKTTSSHPRPSSGIYFQANTDNQLESFCSGRLETRISTFPRLLSHHAAH